ncbi:unnamed protein product, partial [Amoebophrya sp. A120]
PSVPAAGHPASRARGRPAPLRLGSVCIGPRPAAAWVFIRTRRPARPVPPPTGVNLLRRPRRGSEALFGAEEEPCRACLLCMTCAGGHPRRPRASIAFPLDRGGAHT